MYNPQASINMLDSKNDNNIKRSSSMFLSQAKRENNALSKAALQNPPVGNYELEKYDIGEQVRKRAEAGANNPAIANLKMKRGDKAIFISGTDRFQARKIDEAETYIGPGLYEVEGTLEKKGASHGKSSKFLANAPRFHPLPEQKERLLVPGPTAY